MKSLHQVLFLRRLIIPLLARFNPGEIRLRHHYTGERILLHSFLHKGYWWHGKNRERQTMHLFGRVTPPGGVVVEVGGHIGYVSLFFKKLTGLNGRVIVFEPGENNLRYIRSNISGRGIELIEKAVGDVNGKIAFYLDDLTGQNNSVFPDFDKATENEKNAFLRRGSVRKVEVPIVRLDDFVRDRALRVDLVKVDVEGAEWLVLQGMTSVLAEQKPMLMIEIQAHRPEIFNLLTNSGYRLFSPGLKQLRSPERLDANVFAFHADHHAALLTELGLLAPPAGASG